MPDASGKLFPGEPGYVPPGDGGGLINTAPPTAPLVPPTQAKASTATPTAFTVAPNQTVASNVESIIAKDSPLMQQAATRAAQTANARGLLNSSIAINAGQAALYDAALPIASQDALTFDRAASNTAQANNAAALQNSQLATGIAQSNAGTAATEKLQTALARIQSDTTLTAQDKQVQSQQLIAQNENANRMAVAQLSANSALTNIDADGLIKTKIAQITSGYSALVQTSQGAGALYQAMLGELANIARDPGVTDKATAMNNQVKALDDGLRLLGEIQGLNLNANLTFTP